MGPFGAINTRTLAARHAKQPQNQQTTDQTETFTASMEGRLAECLGLVRALLAMTMLVVHTVKPAQKATLGMLLGASLIV